jgi:hypothetical protein
MTYEAIMVLLIASNLLIGTAAFTVGRGETYPNGPCEWIWSILEVAAIIGALGGWI